MNQRTLRADGVSITSLIDGTMPLFELDSYDEPLVMMAAAEGDELNPAVEDRYMEVVQRHAPGTVAVVMTGETARRGNILLKKGVTPIQSSPLRVPGSRWIR